MRNEIKVIQEETDFTHKKFMEHESDLLANLDSKRSKLFEEFNEHTKEAERNLESKLLKLKDSSDIIAEKVNSLDIRLEEKYDTATRLINEKMSTFESKFQDRYDNIIEQTTYTRDSFLKGLKTELDLIRTNLDSIKIDTLNKRDEILSDTRKQTEELETSINKFIKKYLDDENKILKQTDQKKNELLKEIKNFEETLETQKDKAKEDMEKALHSIREQVNSLGEDTFFKMKAVDEHFENLKVAMNESAKEVLDQVEMDTVKAAERIEKEIVKVDTKVNFYCKEWTSSVDKLKERFQKEYEDLEARVNSIHFEGDDLQETLKLEHTQAKLELEVLYNKFQEGLLNKTEMIIDEVKSQGQSVSEKQEATLVDFGEKIVKNVESKLDKAKFQSEEILESITKAGKNLLEKQEEKIDKFNSTLDERISRQLTILIDRGQLQLDALEARIASYVHEVKSNIESNLKIAREDSERQIANFNSQIIKSYKEIESANNHFLDASRKEFARTKDDFISMKNGIESEINRVNELKNNLYSFIADEGAKLQNQKIKSEEIGENLNRTNRSLETLNKKTDEMKDKILLLGSIDEKIKRLSEIQKDFDTKASNLEEVNSKIKTLTESLLIVESNEADASFKLTEILEELGEIQKIEKELHGTIQNIELKTAFLQGRDMDIKSIESKFDKVENLMMDLSARHKQIATMQNRIESLKTETESMKNSLEGLLDEADVRFEKLTDFLSVVDTVTSPYNQKAKVPSTGSKNDSEVMKKKKATVLQLHENFDWNSDTIASKLNMEKSFVEAIINSKK